MVSVQQADFSLAEEYDALVKHGESGAIVTFVGRVRSFSDTSCSSTAATSAKDSNEFFLQHYPGMTEKVLQKIETEAHQRWSLIATKIIHRFGKLDIGEQIVFVGISSPHRKEAFEACEFIIDVLKTEAPFWKKEGNTWVEAKDTDMQATEKWMNK